MQRRIDALAPDRRPLWGKFTAPQMVCHVSAGLRESLGELKAGPPAGPLRFPPINWFAIHVLPWPKGKAKSPPQLLATAPTTWEGDAAGLRRLVDQFGMRQPTDEWPVSTVFGAISGRSWGVLEFRHLDHHLRQFGV
jgi:hypothetical protein